MGKFNGTSLFSYSLLDCLQQMPSPGIVIFVHGVNSDGEWYRAAEAGLCKGLNTRMKRCNEHLCHATPEAGQLTPLRYRSELSDDGYVDPDYTASTFIVPQAHFSPVIQFRWGYKASDKELQQYGDSVYLNEHAYWGGGPFANGCSSLPDLWGEGLSDALFLFIHIEHLNPVNDRIVYACPPRPYFVLAALRLAHLVAAIRRQQADVPITLVCHSQGNMVGIAAAFLGNKMPDVRDAAGKSGRCVADTHVLCNPPYSLLRRNDTEGWLQGQVRDVDGNVGRQSGKARRQTLAAFFDIVRAAGWVSAPNRSRPRAATVCLPSGCLRKAFPLASMAIMTIGAITIASPRGAAPISGILIRRSPNTIQTRACAPASARPARRRACARPPPCRPS
ncbi:T6SS effector phospholipase Tle3 domain-containing protein [Janthinobacterium tructae]|uniref:T6SS effector phospholipase Tle3 domain-containing protein n=1 Tax=Janthinobacterium tructae TaxID=2590869 RepID=UPI003C12C7E7